MSKNLFEVKIDETESENYKGSLLERADKEGWKVTTLKPQGKESEQFIRDKFRDDFWEMFVKPDKTLVARGGGINGDGEPSLENFGDGEDMEEAVYNEMGVELYLSGLTPRQREVAELRLQGYSYEEISEKMGISVKGVDKHIQNIRSQYKR